MRPLFTSLGTGHMIPVFDRKPQTFFDIYRAKDAGFRMATRRIFHSREYPSHMTAGMLP